MGLRVIGLLERDAEEEYGAVHGVDQGMEVDEIMWSVPCMGVTRVGR